MKTPVLPIFCIVSFSPLFLFADQLEMQNGDHYNGKVLSVSSNSVVLQNEVLGKVTLPRTKVASMVFGTNNIPVKATTTAAPVVSTNLPDAAAIAALTKTSSNAASNDEVVKDIREKMLAGSPEAAAKYDELASGLLSGKMNVNDIRREAQSSAEQLRKMKTELGPEAGESLDAYLQVLDDFLKESTPTSMQIH